MKSIKNSPKMWAICLGVVWFILICVGLYLTLKKQPEASVTAPTPTIEPPTFIEPTEWALYKDNDVEFKYPKNWNRNITIPQKIRKVVTLDQECTGITLQDPDHPEVILILNSMPPEKSTPCWISEKELNYYFNKLESITDQQNQHQRSSQLFIEAKSMLIDGRTEGIGGQPYGGENNLISRYVFHSSSATTTLYHFALLYPRAHSEKMLTLLNEILTSFKYITTYRPALTYPIEWRTLENKELGFKFEYPARWGIAEEKLEDHPNIQSYSDPYYRNIGKSYPLTFSGQKNIPSAYTASASGASSDFQLPIEGGDRYYRGDPKKPKGISSEINFTIDGISVASYCSQSDYFSGVFSGGIIKFNFPGNELGGVMLVMPILSPSDMKKYTQIVKEYSDKEAPCMKAWSGEISEDVVWKKLEAKEKEISEMLKNGVRFDEESKLNLKIYQHILGSAKVF